MKSIILIFSLLISLSIQNRVFAQDEVFTFVEQEPSFPGGDEARLKFLQENLKYPEEAKEKGIQGVVYITFVIEIDGAVSNVKVLRGIGGGCDEEAVRVIKLMPKWIPGKQRGRVVRTQFNMPFKFTLADGGKTKKTKEKKKEEPKPKKKTKKIEKHDLGMKEDE